MQATQADSTASPRETTLAALKSAGVVAVVRAPSAEAAVGVARALAAGGVLAIEITFTVPGAADAIAQVARELESGRIDEGLVLGAGTVVTADQAKAAVDAGARFLVSPHAVPEVLSFARQYGIAALPGALTPGEVFNAHQQGGDIIKIFPAARMGPDYLKDLAGPYPHIPLMPTGGVSVENVGQWLGAGAVAVGVGSELVNRQAVREGRWDELTLRARAFAEAIHHARRSTN